jgi:enamine deaminase RidA (YjgF/YER057c/UK114 family)
MKKLFLAATAVSLLAVTSCKKDEKKVENATENATETATNTAEKAGDNVENVAKSADVASDVPKFSSPEIQKFAEDYAAYYKDVTAAAQSGDATKIQDLQTKAMEWTKKATEMTQKMTPEDAKKWTEWSQKIAMAAMGK